MKGFGKRLSSSVVKRRSSGPVQAGGATAEVAEALAYDKAATRLIKGLEKVALLLFFFLSSLFFRLARARRR